MGDFIARKPHNMVDAANGSAVGGTKDMQTLLACRDLLKGSIKRMMTFAQNPPGTITSEQIATRLSHLESVWKEYTHCSEALCEFKTNADFVKPEEEFSACEDMYLDTHCLLKALLPKQSNNTNVIVEQQSDIIKQLTERLKKLETSSATGHSPPKKDDDLPNIVIAPFSGNYKEWPSFEDLFKSALDSKPNWTNKQKFDYMKTLLRGDAANLIKQMRLSDESFSIAWDRLKKQYDRPQYVVNSYIETFMTLPTMSNGTGSELRKIYNGASDIIRSLDAMGKSERDHWLIYILMSKLDGQTSRKWAEQSCDDPNPTITTFLNFLDQFSQELGNGDEYYTKTNTTKAATKNTRRTATTKAGNRHPYYPLPSLQSADECRSLPEIQSSVNKGGPRQYKGYNNRRQGYNPKTKHANQLVADPSTATNTTKEETSSNVNLNQKPLVDLSPNLALSQRTTMPPQFGHQNQMATYNSPQISQRNIPSQFGHQQLMTMYNSQQISRENMSNVIPSTTTTHQFGHQQPIPTYIPQQISQGTMPSRFGQQQHMRTYNSQQISSLDMQKFLTANTTTNTRDEASVAKVSQDFKGLHNMNQKPLTGMSAKVNPFRTSSQQILCENVKEIVPLPTTTTTTTSTDESSTAKASDGINLNQKQVVDISTNSPSPRDPPSQHGDVQNIQNSQQISGENIQSQTQSPQMMPSFPLDASPETIEYLKYFLSRYEAQRATTSALVMTPTQPQEKQVLEPDVEGKSQSSSDFSAIPI